MAEVVERVKRHNMKMGIIYAGKILPLSDPTSFRLTHLSDPTPFRPTHPSDSTHAPTSAHQKLIEVL